MMLADRNDFIHGNGRLVDALRAKIQQLDRCALSPVEIVVRPYQNVKDIPLMPMEKLAAVLVQDRKRKSAKSFF